MELEIKYNGKVIANLSPGQQLRIPAYHEFSSDIVIEAVRDLDSNFILSDNRTLITKENEVFFASEPPVVINATLLSSDMRILKDSNGIPLTTDPEE